MNPIGISFGGRIALLVDNLSGAIAEVPRTFNVNERATIKVDFELMHS